RQAHLLRAVMEGVAFSLRSCLNAVTDVSGPLTGPAFTGGGFTSSLWRAIVAAALDVEGHRSAEHGPALGAAILAARATGAEIPPRASGDRITPDPAWVDRYRALFSSYERAVDSTARVARELRVSRSAARSELGGQS